jgi:hypothetical protein
MAKMQMCLFRMKKTVRCSPPMKDEKSPRNEEDFMKFFTLIAFASFSTFFFVVVACFRQFSGASAGIS